MARVKFPSSTINPIEEKQEEDDSLSSSLSSSKSASHALACVINSEIAAILAVMRRNVLWDDRCGYGADDHLNHSLIQPLKSLRRNLFSSSTSDRLLHRPSAFLIPFLDVIRSNETGAPITSVDSSF